MQPRRIARELALLSISQLPNNPEKLDQQSLQDILLAAVRALLSEVRESLEAATSELQRSNECMGWKTLQAGDIERSAEAVREAMTLTQSAINRLGATVELPEMVQMSEQFQVQDYALVLIGAVARHREEIDHHITESLVNWQLERLAQIDRDILRLAVAEMLYLETPNRVVINEAVELAKRYSDDDSYRFINGVLRRASDRLKTVTPRN
jgi:N utilization substance protein B